MSSLAVEPFLVRVRLIKLKTDDGALSLADALKVGDYFIVDLATKSPVPVHTPDQRIVMQAVVQCAEDGKWLPWECLQVMP